MTESVELKSLEDKLDYLEVQYDARGHYIAALEGHIKQLRRVLETITVPCDCGAISPRVAVESPSGHTSQCSIIRVQEAVHSVRKIPRQISEW